MGIPRGPDAWLGQPLPRAPVKRPLPRAILVTVACVLVWRIAAAFPAPFITPSFLAKVAHGGESQTVFGFLAASPFEHLSFVSLGLGPVLVAWLIMWLASIVSETVRGVWSDHRRLWSWVAVLACLLAFLGAYGKTQRWFADHPSDVLATTGLIDIAGVTVGTMGLLTLGRVIDGVGVPPGFGVWFLFALGSLQKGLRAVIYFVADPANQNSSAHLELAVYAAATVALVIVLAALWPAARYIVVRPAESENADSGQQSKLPVALMGGGFVIAVMGASAVINFPSLIAEVLPSSVQAWFKTNYFVDGPIPLVSAAIVIFHVLLVFGFSLFVCVVSFPADRYAQELKRSHYEIAGFDPSTDSASGFQRSAGRLALWGAAALCLVAVVLPALFTATFEGMRHVHGYLVVGGGTFVLATTFFLESATRVSYQLRVNGRDWPRLRSYEGILADNSASMLGRTTYSEDWPLRLAESVLPRVMDELGDAFPPVIAVEDGDGRLHEIRVDQKSFRTTSTGWVNYNEDLAAWLRDKFPPYVSRLGIRRSMMLRPQERGLVGVLIAARDSAEAWATQPSVREDGSVGATSWERFEYDADRMPELVAMRDAIAGLAKHA